jgi:hypothetical protein
MSEDE